MSPHGGQDWLGFAIVMGVLGICLLVGWLETRNWFRDQDADLKRIIDEAIDRAEPDHVACANPDCDQTICACRKPAECTGCTTLGCDHPNQHQGLLCWDCRLDCRECATEERTLRDLDWAAGR